MTAPLSPAPVLSSGRLRTTRIFLLFSVVTLAIGLGAKIFDLLVVAMAWGASPPASFAHLPYGKEFPIDPGNFFQPLSALITIGIVGALISGWKSSLRVWLLVPVLTFGLIWILTPTIFWPMINQLWAVHRGRLTLTDVELVALVRRWFIGDSFRIVLIGAAFLSSVRALSGPIFSSGRSSGKE